MLIGRLVSYFNTKTQNETDLEHAYIYSACLTVNMLFLIVFFHSTQLEMVHYGMKMRIACCSVIFRKVSLIINENNYDYTTPIV